MRKDPIVTETRSLREQYANQFGHNADAIFQDILRRQAESGKKLISFAHRKAVISEVIAKQESPISDLQT
jgi:hypothetical protein